MTSKMLKFMNSQKTQKSKYFDNDIFLYRQIKKFHSLYIKDYNIGKNSFLVEVTSKDLKSKEKNI